MPLSRRMTILGMVMGAVLSLPAQDSSAVFKLMKCMNLPKPMAYNGAAVVGNRLFVIGGRIQRDGWSTRVFSAEIKPDSSLGEWVEDQPLPEFRVYIGSSVEVVNDRIYVVAGSIPSHPALPEGKNSTYANDVLWTRLQPDGQLAEWQHSVSYPGDPVTCAATCSSDRQLFVLGGRHQMVGSDRVLVADLAPDGAPANWRMGRKLPMPLYFLQAALLEDRIYVWGGLSTNSRSATVEAFSATVDADGQIGTWTKEPPMRKPYYSSVFCGFNDYLISAGGMYPGGIPSSEIWFTRLKDGHITQWMPLSTDLGLAAYRSIGFDKAHGVVYLIGGLHRDATGKGPGTARDSVQAFRLPQPGEAKLVAAPEAGRKVFFASLNEALTQGRQSGKPVLVFFYSPEAPSCRRFWDNVARTPGFSELTKSCEWGAIDITTMGQQECHRVGVFKVPAMVLFAPDGSVKGRALTVRSLDDVKALVGGN